MSTDHSSDEFEPSEHESAFLASARRGLSPNEADAVRVGAAVAKLTAAPLAPSPTAKGVDPATTPGSSAWWKLGFAAAFAAGTGVAGYHLGFEAGRATFPPATAHAHNAPHRPSPEPALPVLTEKKDETPATPSEPTQSEPTQTPRTPPGATAPAAPSAATAPASSLEEETRMVARIERALRDRNARFALGLLGELDRTVPGGQLKEERDAARVLAHCQLDGGSAAALRSQFTKRYPKSAYAGRIGQTCRALTTSESGAP